MPQYEVWCHACNVTFPPGTRVCLHCGGRTRSEPPRSRRGAREPEIVLADARFAAGPQEMRGLELPGRSDESAEEEPGRRSALRTAITVLWMILLIAGYAWRACSSQ